MTRLCSCAILLLLASLWAPARAFDADSVRCVLDRMPLHAIEGIWQLTATQGLTIVIWRQQPAPGAPAADLPVYTMQLVKAPDRSRTPGELLGTLRPTAQPGVYDARVAVEFDSRGLIKRTRRFTVKAVDAAHLSFTPVKSSISLSPILLVPPFLRRGIKLRQGRDPGLDGAIKLYPPVPVKGSPRYL